MHLIRPGFAFIVALLAGCASVSTSELVSVSRDPGMQDASFSTFYVMALDADADRRRIVEQAVASQLRDAGVRWCRLTRCRCSTSITRRPCGRLQPRR